MYKYLWLFLVLPACSVAPDQIRPVAAVGQPFAGHDCSQLVSERITYAEQLEAAKDIQRQRASGDIGLFLVGGALALGVGKSVAGPDEEQTIATYRGAIMEIDEESRRKGCSDPVFYTPEPEEPETERPNRERPS